MLTKDEAELYDRQIRLWGVNAQSRLRQSRVLMLGFNGIASEVAKILVLAGIDTLTIVDDQPLQDDDITSNLFCNTMVQTNGSHDKPSHEAKFRTHQVREKLKTLNSLVNINIDNTSILDKEPEAFENYDLVTLHSILTIDQTNQINDICRKLNIKFYLVIDYGFFGFMFNDLGKEFKFTYEQYNDKKQDKSASNAGKIIGMHSGGEKDPISFDDEPTDLGQESTDGDAERDNERPKKRIRLEERHEDDKEDADKDDMKHIAGAASFVTFRDMISFKGAKFDRKTSPILFISIAIIKFYSERKHLPMRGSTVSDQDDLSKLNEILDSMKHTLGLSDTVFKKLDPDWSKNITGSLSAVCAIVGGVAGQDMIRALSGKDIPICNTFSFDGMEMSGVIERLGIEDDEKERVNDPVVRDFLQIEDSN